MKTILSILLLAAAFAGVGQSNPGKKIQSTEAKKEVASSPMELIDKANKLAQTDAAKSMELASTALEKSLEQKNKSGEYYSYNTLGTLYFNIGNFAKAATYFRQARDGFISIKDEKGGAYAEKYLSLTLEKQQKYEEALKVADQSEKRQVMKKDVKANSSYNKARLKSKAGRKQEAISDLTSLSLDSSLSPENKINIYKELGDLYVANSDTIRALEAYDKVLKLEEKSNNNGYNSTARNGLYDVANKVSELNLKNGNTTDNLAIQNGLLAEGLKSKDPDLVQTANFNIGATYLKQNQEEQAIPYLSNSATIAKDRGNAKEEQRSVKELARAYENTGQYDKALDVYKRYVLLTDSFKSLEAGHEEASLALNKEFLKQEARIKGLMDSEKEKEASIQRQKNILWTLSGGLLLLAILVWALVRNIKQKQRANMFIKLQSLRTQMNPHFIFNSLNSVNNFIAKNDERSANKYLTDFSKLMRTVLKNSDMDFVRLSSEIETLSIYLELEHFRFGDKFEYRLDIAPDIEPESVQIPPMLIQPYIENAIWHGLRYKEEKGFLEVKFFIEDKKLFCTIYDNGIGRKKSAELKTTHQKSYQSTGIKNTKERIELLNKLHKTSLGISIFDLDDGETGTLVKISLPHIMEESDAQINA